MSKFAELINVNFHAAKEILLNSTKFRNCLRATEYYRFGCVLKRRQFSHVASWPELTEIENGRLDLARDLLPKNFVSLIPADQGDPL